MELNSVDSVFEAEAVVSKRRWCDSSCLVELRIKSVGDLGVCLSYISWSIPVGDEDSGAAHCPFVVAARVQ